MAQDNNSPINKARQEVKKKVEAARVAAIKRKGDNQLKKISSSIKEEYHQLIVKYLERGKTKSRRESASAKSRLDAIAKIKSRYRGKEITEIQEAKLSLPINRKVAQAGKKYGFTAKSGSMQSHGYVPSPATTRAHYSSSASRWYDENNPKDTKYGGNFGNVMLHNKSLYSKHRKQLPDDVRGYYDYHHDTKSAAKKVLKEALGRSYRPWRSRVKGPALSSKPQKKLPFTLSTTTDKEQKPKYQRDVEAAIDKEDDPRYMREGKDYSKALDRLARSEARDGKKIRPEDVKKKIKKHLKEDQEKTCGLWGTKRAADIKKKQTPGEKMISEAKKWRPGMSKKELAALKTSAKVVADKRKASKAKTLSSPKPAPAPAKEPETGGSRLDWFNKQPELQRWLRANVHPADRERVMDHIWNSPPGKAFDTVAKYKSGEHKYRKPPKPGP